MALRTYPIDPTDADLVAAAQAEGIPVATAAQALAAVPPETMAGLRAWIVSPESFGAGVDEWRAAWPVLAGRGDVAIRFLMRLLAAKTKAVVYDPGT